MRRALLGWWLQRGFWAAGSCRRAGCCRGAGKGRQAADHRRLRRQRQHRQPHRQRGGGARSQGHRGRSRPKPELAPKGVELVTGDALSPEDILKNIAGADVVVSAVVVRPAPTADFALSVVQSFVTALRQQQGTKKTRFLDVGGGSSL